MYKCLTLNHLLTAAVQLVVPRSIPIQPPLSDAADISMTSDITNTTSAQQ